jgi:hypothetical protein
LLETRPALIPIPFAAIYGCPRNVRLRRPNTLLRAPRRRACNLSRYKSLPSYSLSLARTGCGHKMRPRRGHYRGLPPAECGAKIIIRHAPRLQGESFTGLSQHQRKFSNVASEHHFLGLSGGTCVTALATAATDG